MQKFETIPGTEMMIDTVNPGKYEWRSFWQPDTSGYTGSYFTDRQKEIEQQIFDRKEKEEADKKLREAQQTLLSAIAYPTEETTLVRKQASSEI